MSVAWGILSTAHINRLVLAGARKSERVDVVAVASRDAARAESFARRNGIERAYPGYDELLADDDVEAVYVPLPNSLHVEWSIRALEAGKHVLCEKPLSRRVHEVERAFGVAKRAGRLLMEGFMYRHHPQTRRLVALVEEGVIGRLQLIRAAFSFTVRDARNIRLLAELDGGSLMDVGCYCVNGARLLAGEPTRVAGAQMVARHGIDVRFQGTMRFADDVVSQFDCGLDLPFRDELEVVGSDGALFLDDPWHCRSPLIELRRDGATERIEIEPADSYQLELENLSDAIRGRGEPLLRRADAVGQARAIEALYAAAT